MNRAHTGGVRTASVAVFLACSSAACAQAAPPEASTALGCVAKIRLHGTVYICAGYTEVRGTRFSIADQADCEDVGPSPRGSVFSEDSQQVAVWSLPGYSTDEVVAVPFNEETFTVFVADSLARDELERIVRVLSAPPR